MHLSEVALFAENKARCHIKYDGDSPRFPYSFYLTSEGEYYEAPRIRLHMSEEAFKLFKDSILEQLEAIELSKKLKEEEKDVIEKSN